MKLSALSKCVKNGGMCSMLYVGEFNDVWIETRNGIYSLRGFPVPANKDELAMILGIDPEKMGDKITYNEDIEQDKTYIGRFRRFDLNDTVEPEVKMVKMGISLSIKDQEFELLTDEERNQIAVLDADCLAPLRDEFQKSSYMAFYMRKSEATGKYIVVKDGFDIRAAVVQPEKTALMESITEALTLMRMEECAEGK